MSDTQPTDSVFTPKEIEYMAAAVMCLKEGVPTNAQIDTDAFTAMTNLTAGSAAVTWNKLRRKLEAQALTRGTGIPSTPKTEKKSKSRATPASKRKGTGDGDGEGGASPSKKPRGKKGKVQAQVVKGEGEGEGQGVNEGGAMGEEVA